MCSIKATILLFCCLSKLNLNFSLVSSVYLIHTCCYATVIIIIIIILTLEKPFVFLLLSFCVT